MFFAVFLFQQKYSYELPWSLQVYAELVEILGVIRLFRSVGKSSDILFSHRLRHADGKRRGVAERMGLSVGTMDL